MITDVFLGPPILQTALTIYNLEMLRTQSSLTLGKSAT